MRATFLITLLLAIGLGADRSQPVEIIAHRGASYDAPENTLASVQLGWKQQADANEVDIYLSRDGQIVAIHDATTQRTTGVDKKVVDLTLEELRALDVGSWKDAKWQGEKVPTLAEVLATVPDGKRVFIEIKCGPEVLPELERVLDRSGRSHDQHVIIAFDYDTVKLAKARFPELEVYWLVAPKKDTDGKEPTVREMIERARAAEVDGINIKYEFAIDEAFVARVKAAGLKLYIWTVNDEAVAKRLAELGVDGITTDRPGWLREQLQLARVAR